MPRRKRQSAFEDWVQLLAHLPWQVSLLLAAASWFGFHQLATMKLPSARTAQELSASYTPLMLITLGTFMQVIAPTAFGFAALLSWFGKRRRTKLLTEAEQRKESAPLVQLNWKEFEQLVGAHFERLGYSVHFTPDGADGGIDVVARKGGEIFLIQCKQWRATQVGVSVVRELFGLIAAQGATGGYVVSIGPFTADARAFAAGRNIELIDANRLLRQSTTSGRPPTRSPKEEIPHLAASSYATPGFAVPPTCPKCGGSMIRRVAKQGTNAGKAFFGCSQYPKCRGVLPGA